MDSHHHDIIRLAWSRHLQLGDAALRSGHRHIRIDPEATTITFVRLGDSSALVGPESAVTAAEKHSDDDLARNGLPGQRNRPLVLAFAGDIGTTIDRHDPLISHSLDHVLALEASSAPDDVLAADLTRKRSWFTVMGDDRPADSATPLACAAYLEWEGLLADVGVLTAPHARRLGNAQVVARLATNDAIDDGLIPQWRVASDNTVARRLAARLGYEEWGVTISADVSSH